MTTGVDATRLFETLEAAKGLAGPAGDPGMQGPRAGGTASAAVHAGGTGADGAGAGKPTGALGTYTEGVRLVISFLLLWPAGAFAAESAAALGEQLRQIELDPGQCYRVRDLEFAREDIGLFFKDGLMIFAKPVAGQRLLAAFSAGEEGDDAEILLRAPNRSERASLAKSTGSPNLNEHFQTALLVFTDGGAEELLEKIRAGVVKERPDEGILLAGRMNELARNFAQSFQVRLVLDLLTMDTRRGLFYAALASRGLGNFDAMYDPTLPEQVVVGEVSETMSGYFDVWASFESRSRRAGKAGPEDGVVIEDYRIESTVAADLSMKVTAKAKVAARKRAAGALMFELAPQMEVTGVTVDGQPAEVFRRDSMRAHLVGGSANDPFLVVLPAPLESGSAHEIVFQCEGKLIRPAGNNVFFVAARTNWYPSRGYRFTTFDLTFRVPKPLRVVATGDLASESEEGEWRVSRHRTAVPVRLAGFNIGDYESVEVKKGGLTVRVAANRLLEPALVPKAAPQLVVVPPQVGGRGAVRRTGEILAMPPPPPPDPKARLGELAAEIESAMEWMSSKFGPPPLATVTVSPIPGNFGQGFPGLVYLSTISYLSESERPAALRTAKQHTFYSEILCAHELAHQWWGNLVTAPTYRDEWIQEALANYTALMVLERRKGPRALETALLQFRDELMAESGEPKERLEAKGPITWGSRLRAEVGVDPWRVIVYDKGSWILHMLRRRMGDGPFLAMLGELRKKYSYRGLTTEEFRAAAARFLAKGDPDPELESFFDSWVYSTGIPALEVSTRVRGKAPPVELQVSVKQSGVGADFALDLPVEIRLPRQAAPLVKWIRTGTEPEVLRVKLKAAPLKVEVAPGLGVLEARR